MSIELLVFFYMAVSVAMGVFEFVYLARERVHARRFEKLTARTTVELAREIRENADFPTPEHKRTLARSLRTMAGAEAFDLTMDKLALESADLSGRYLHGISDVFAEIAPDMAQKPVLNQAYFAYLISKWYKPGELHELRGVSGGPVMLYLHEAVRAPSLYVRQNAIEALSQVGSAHGLNEALRFATSDDAVFYHPRLLTESAMAFAGSHEELAALLRESYDDYPEHAHPAIINFWRMSGTGDNDTLIGYLSDDQLDGEVRMATMRYFGSHCDERAYRVLYRLADDHDPADWEFAVVASGALAGYPRPETVDLLKRNLSSPTWFVRNAAAQSLVRIARDHALDFSDILEGEDAYAREMLSYHLEQAPGVVSRGSAVLADPVADLPIDPRKLRLFGKGASSTVAGSAGSSAGAGSIRNWSVWA